ncbi:uncharacterized protein LOC144917455 [Branchiostoma floridae x Branchiostoma belcheri]
MGEENSMGVRLPGKLLSLLIFLKVLGSTEASCRLSGSTASCSNLASIPQNLPTGITLLDLAGNHITTISQSDFSRYGNLTRLILGDNHIATISTRAFYNLSDLRVLHLDGNRLSNCSADMFTGLGNLQELWLENNEISDIQAGTFHSTLELRTLDLQHNRLTILKADIFAKLSSIHTVNISNNPWQCDCRMVPFRQKMNGSHSFENQIICEGPRNFHGQKLKDISPEDLICEVPTIARFERVYKFTEVEGGNLHLVCKASGIPTPDITVILPSGLSANVESGGRVTVGVNGAITITSVTAADAGLYVCTAVSPFGSTFATLVVNVQLPGHESAFSISTSVFIYSVFGSVAGTAFIGAIIFAIWYNRKKQNPSSDQPPPVVFSNTSANVPISEHDQTGEGGDQATSESFETTRSSEHVPGRATSEDLVYEDVVLPPRNVSTSPNAAGLIQQPKYQSLEPNRNRAPRDELPPLPPPSNRNNGGPTGTHGTPHYYQSLKKKSILVISISKD